MFSPQQDNLFLKPDGEGGVHLYYRIIKSSNVFRGPRVEFLKDGEQTQMGDGRREKQYLKKERGDNKEQKMSFNIKKFLKDLPSSPCSTCFFF